MFRVSGMDFFNNLAKDLEILGYSGMNVVYGLKSTEGPGFISEYDKGKKILDCLPFYNASISIANKVTDYDAYDEIEGIRSYNLAKVRYGINDDKIEHPFADGAEIPKCLPAKIADILLGSGNDSDILHIDISGKTYHLVGKNHLDVSPSLQEVMKLRGLTYSAK